MTTESSVLRSLGRSHDNAADGSAGRLIKSIKEEDNTHNSQYVFFTNGSKNGSQSINYPFIRKRFWKKCVLRIAANWRVAMLVKFDARERRPKPIPI